MKPDRYEVTRDRTGKATAVPVFDQPYGTLDRFGRVSKVKSFPSGAQPTASASEFYDGVPDDLNLREVEGKPGSMYAGQVGKLHPSMITHDGQVLQGGRASDADKLQIAGTLVEGQPGKYHYMGGVHYDPTLAQINTSTPNALTPIDPQVAAIRRMERDYHADQAIKRLYIGKIAASHRTPEFSDLVGIQQNPHEVFGDRVDYYTDFMKQKSLRGRLPGFLGPIATIGTATAAAFTPQETQAMSKEQADLLSQFDQGYSQVPKSKGEIFVNSVKDSTLSDMSMAPGTVAGERVVNALLPQKTPMVMQTPTQYGLQRVLPRMAGGVGMGIVAAPEVEGFLTGNSDYDYNKHGISLEPILPIDIGRIPYHFNRAVFGTADPIGAIGNAFKEEMKNPSPWAETLRNSMDF